MSSLLIAFDSSRKRPLVERKSRRHRHHHLGSCPDREGDDVVADAAAAALDSSLASVRGEVGLVGRRRRGVVPVHVRDIPVVPGTSILEGS